MSKGQIAAEFMILLGVLLLFFALFVSAFADKREQTFLVSENLEARRVADNLAMKVGRLYICGPGCSENIYFPEEIRTHNYSMRFVDNLFVIEWDDKIYASPLVTDDISGDIISGTRSTLENINGTLVIS